ncbi:HalOD1 output domain-containing protein [Haloprofundus salilacus]|uniref:HalOD1 output domain-containing protein n=1 Tax=Haloprofundus salilacus TaxID=2876190 RepID=UPI001CCBB6F3|nr:HalOD1 output domain-containing protein [Haloprofundus salilacus]
MVPPIHYYRRSDETSLGVDIARAVGERFRVDPASLPPLANSFDAEAAETVLESEADTAVVFTYLGHRITVTNESVITIESPEGGSDRGRLTNGHDV